MTAPEPAIFSRLRTTASPEWLREPGLDLQVRGTNGQTLLHEAIAFRKSDFAIELIKLGADLDAVNKKGESPLHYAAIYRDVAVAKCLLEHGARLDIADKFGNEALWAAAMNAKGNYETVVAMVERGADTSHKNKVGKSPEDIANVTGDTALLQAMTGNRK